MCLKKFVKYTFSNREAFDRLVKIVEEDYGEYIPEGEIYVVNSYRSWGVERVKNNRDSWSYDELMGEIELFYSPFEHWDIFSFMSWEEWKDTLENVKGKQDVFGYVEIELQ